MTLRTEAGDNCMSSIFEMAREPMGSPVSRYRSTSRRKMSWLRVERASKNADEFIVFLSIFTILERGQKKL